MRYPAGSTTADISVAFPRGTGNGQLSGPVYGVAVTAGDMVFMSDTLGNRVVQFSVSGTTLTFMRNIAGATEPMGLGLSFDNRVLYVAWASTGSVRQYFISSATLLSLQVNGGRPVAVAVDALGTMFIADQATTARSVRVVSAAGVQLSSIDVQSSPVLPQTVAVQPSQQSFGVLLISYSGRFGFRWLRHLGYSAASQSAYTFSARLQDTVFNAADTSLVSVGFTDNSCQTLAPGKCRNADMLCTGVTVVSSNGATCNDGLPCTSTDVCQSGSCVGTTATTCSAAGDQCHVAAVCDPLAGCVNPNKADGTTCDDNTVCTPSSTCQSGVCTGINPTVCNALGMRHDAGTCDPVTGVCSNPAKSDGSTCDDSNGCTLNDQCQSGVCVGSAKTCATTDDTCFFSVCQAFNNGQCTPQTLRADAPASCTVGTCILGMLLVCRLCAHD